MITRVAAVRPSIPQSSPLNCITAALDVMMSRSADRAGEAMRNKNWRIVIGLSLAMIIVGLIGTKV